MKALIFNSGLGKRMGALTENTHKSMVELVGERETIFERQIRILSSQGITEFVVTTGPFQEQLERVMDSDQFKNLRFSIKPNRKYENTNYIYSMYLARKELVDDTLILHGDLVFNEDFIRKMLEDDGGSIAAVNRNIPKPEKDFKARVVDGYITEIGVDIFDDNCYAFQPIYKLRYDDLYRWIERVESFVREGYTFVYAENALNEITDKVKIKEFSYKDDFVDEIDNLEDLRRVSSEIKKFD